MTRSTQTPTQLNIHHVNHADIQSNAQNFQPPSPTPIVADTGATAHFFEHRHSNLIHTTIPVTHITPTAKGISVLLPNQAHMHSTHTGLLNVPDLPLSARQVHLFPKLASGSLLSVGQLCDAGCQATFDKQHLRIYYKGKTIMQGTRQPNKLWQIDNTKHHSLNSVIDAPTVAERVAFHHKSLFSPTLSTLAKAINAG